MGLDKVEGGGSLDPEEDDDRGNLALDEIEDGGRNKVEDGGS